MTPLRSAVHAEGRARKPPQKPPPRGVGSVSLRSPSRAGSKLRCCQNLHPKAPRGAPTGAWAGLHWAGEELRAAGAHRRLRRGLGCSRGLCSRAEHPG